MKNKKFYYNGKNYFNADYVETYERESTWKSIFYTIANESRPYFRHNGKRFYIDNFTRTNYPAGDYTEIKAADGETAFLHAYESETYYKPLFIEIDESGEKIRVYRYIGTETKYN